MSDKRVANQQFRQPSSAAGFFRRSARRLRGSGWQWLFLVQGLPATLLGVAAYFYLQDKPKTRAG